MWRKRKHGNMEYYLSQVLTGHGVLRIYTYKIAEADDTAEHSIFGCQRWVREKGHMEIAIEVELDPDNDNLVQVMLR